MKPHGAMRFFLEVTIVWRFTADYHTHTKYSHGTGTVEQNVEAAIERGLKTIGIADHGPANWPWIGIRRLANFDRMIADVEAARRKYSEITILSGTEANLISYDGEIDIPEEYIGRLDQILVGFHTMIIPKRWFEGWRFMCASMAAKKRGERFQQVRKANTQALIAAVERYPIKIITHPGLKIAIDSLELAKACAARGTALEINARHGVESVGFVIAAASTGVKFALSSDAHAPKEVGLLEPAALVARAADLPVSQMINVEEDV